MEHYMEAMTGLSMKKRRAHRGKRRKKKGTTPAGSTQATVNAHIDNAKAASDPVQARKHLFKALSAMKAKKAGPVGNTTNAGVPLTNDPISEGTAS